ncbi:MAG: SprB repeat-containing protein, partial [Bacteroidota bacterium]
MKPKTMSDSLAFLFRNGRMSLLCLILLMATQPIQGIGLYEEPEGLIWCQPHPKVANEELTIPNPLFESTAPTNFFCPLSLSFDGTSPSCQGGVDGSIDLTVTGGQGPYTYQWSPGGSTVEDPTNLFAFFYSVTVTDANGCMETGSYFLFDGPLIIVIINGTSVDCATDTNGSISLNVFQGNPPYTYQWDSGLGTIQSPTNLGVGVYTVTVTDLLGCGITATASVDSPPLLVGSVDFVGAACDGNATGFIDLNMSGGSPPYVYQWDNGAGINEDPSGLIPGTYTVTVTDVNDCVFNTSVAITNSSAITASATGEMISCVGGMDGDISLTLSGGSLPYTFDWDNAPDVQNPGGLSAGTYVVTVSDIAGCFVTASADITEPNNFSGTSLAADVLCNGENTGSITFTPSGGIAPLTYTWDNGAGTVQNPSGLSAGTYTVTVTDAAGCLITSSVEVNEPPILGISVDNVNVSCIDPLNGSIDISISGGTGPYTYQWDNGAGTDQDPTGLPYGTYSVTVTDNNNCEETASATLTDANTLAISLTSADALCNGEASGSIDLTVTGGAIPFTYQWDNGVTDEDPINLSIGTYSITVTDINGCDITGSTSIGEPPLLTTSAIGESLLCNGDADGDIDLTVGGGTPPYTYFWNNGGGLSEDPTGLTASVYTVTVTDNNGCTSTTSAAIDEPTALTASTSGDFLNCTGDTDGTIDLTVSG